MNRWRFRTSSSAPVTTSAGRGPMFFHEGSEAHRLARLGDAVGIGIGERDLDRVEKGI